MLCRICIVFAMTVLCSSGAVVVYNSWIRVVGGHADAVAYRSGCLNSLHSHIIRDICEAEGLQQLRIRRSMCCFTHRSA